MTKVRRGDRGPDTKPRGVRTPDAEDYRDARATKEREDARYRAAKAAIAELDLAERQGELISRAEAEEAEARRVLLAKSKLYAIPRSMARRLYGLEPRDIEQELRDAIDHVCEELSGAGGAGGRRRKRSAAGSDAKPTTH